MTGLSLGGIFTAIFHSYSQRCGRVPHAVKNWQWQWLSEWQMFGLLDHELLEGTGLYLGQKGLDQLGYAITDRLQMFRWHMLLLDLTSLWMDTGFCVSDFGTAYFPFNNFNSVVIIITTSKYNFMTVYICSTFVLLPCNIFMHKSIKLMSGIT